MLKFILAALAAALLIYAVWGRPWLKSKPWAAGFFAAIEPLELALWKKSETILFARLKMAIGAVLMCLAWMGDIDLTPIMPLVPAQYQAYVHTFVNMLPLLITVVGWMDEQLRKTTTKPLEVVALPDALPADVADAVAKAEAAKFEAVAVAVEAKQAGTL